VPATPAAAAPTPAVVPAIDIANLRHAFKGHKALDGVSFQVPARTIHGFVGPNGAGKTTTLRVLATLLRPAAGRVLVFGENLLADPTPLRRRIGFMPDHFSMYQQMTVFEYLDFFAAAYGQAAAERDKTVAGVLALTDMAGRQGDRIKGLSRGMQQRVALARVLVHDPDLLLLDEPASGLDPRARIELMEILRELRGMGKTVFISSHILAELGDLCDGVTILDRGTVQYSGTVAGLRRGEATAETGQAWILAVEDAAHAAAIATAAAAIPGVAKVEADPADAKRLTIQLAAQPPAGTTNAVLAAALAAGATVVEFRERLRDLGTAFMDLTTAGVRAR
jgi:ABC-2 type transport system ATP-binding protein